MVTRGGRSRPSGEEERAVKFDTPLERCPHCGEYVPLDQTQRECAHEHHCPAGRRCPLDQFFTGHEFGRSPEREKKR